MYTLYIDTHMEKLVVALFKNDDLLERTEIVSSQHSNYVMSSINDVITNAKIEVDDIKEIIVINGPGSFTGVRIGIVIAKVWAFAKNVSVKSLSYLEAMALNYDRDVTLGLKDRNGVFIGKFNQNHELTCDYFYLSNKEFNDYDENVLLEDNVDLHKVVKFMKTKDSINPHLLVPLYVKKIEVGK